MRLSVVFTCASLLVIAESRGGKSARGNKGKPVRGQPTRGRGSSEPAQAEPARVEPARGPPSSGRGSSGHGKRGNKLPEKVEHSDAHDHGPHGHQHTDALPAWTKYCESLENWAEKPGKSLLVKRCKCFNAKKNGEQVSTECEHHIAGHKADPAHPPASIFERLCAKAKKGSKLETKCKCRVILESKGNEKMKRLCKQQMDGTMAHRQEVKDCRQLKVDLNGIKPKMFTTEQKAMKLKCEILSNAAKEKMHGFVSERRERILRCKTLMAKGKESLPRDDLMFMRKSCPHLEQSELHG